MPHDEGSKMTNAEVAYRASSKGIEERNELVLRELPQVYYVAARIRERLPKHVEMEDLVQAGVIGLLDACRNYDNEHDAQFSTFAKHRIRGAILDSLRKLDWGSRTLRRKGREIAVSAARLESQLGRYPIEEECTRGSNLQPNQANSTPQQLSLARRVLDGLRTNFGKEISTAPPVLLCSSPGRYYLRRLLEPFIPRVVVISPGEIPPLTPVQSLGVLH